MLLVLEWVICGIHPRRADTHDMAGTFMQGIKFHYNDYYYKDVSSVTNLHTVQENGIEVIKEGGCSCTRKPLQELR